MANRLNALSLEERRRTRLEGLWAPWLDAMTEEEKAEFLEVTMPTGLKQMLSAFETMPENDRRLAVSDALRQLREAREALRREGAWPAEPPSTNPPVILSQERQDQIVKLGLRTYYRESSAQTKAELAPLLEEMRCRATWGCSLFAALGDEDNRLFGRNFDWQFSPALLLFTDPVDGYASVSMVDIEYLGFEGEYSQNITDLPLEKRRRLLDAPSLPFDGMNENGLAIGMAAVPAEDMPYDQQKKTIDQLEVISEVLDHAGTVDEAIDILGSFNIDMGSVPIHYMIASASGDSAVVEFYKGEMVIFQDRFRKDMGKIEEAYQEVLRRECG